jgi:hypothetical protein
MKHPCIGLFGTCGSSKWRNDFINRYELLSINYFNPQKDNWKPEDAANEAEHLVNDDVILFPITGETYAFGSLAETGFSISQAIRSNVHRFVVIMISPTLDPELMENTRSAKESIGARALVIAHLKKVNHPNVYLVDSLNDMLELSINLHTVVAHLNSINTEFRK